MALTREALRRELGEALGRPVSSDTDWAEAFAGRASTPRLQLVALLLIMDVSPQLVNGWRHRSAEDDLIRSLPRKKLPWDAETAAFALRAALAIDAMSYVCAPALRGAETAMDAGHRDAELYEALEASVQHLDGLMSGRFASRYGVDKDLKVARRLRASFLPSGVLDLTVVDDGDEWAERARRLARALPVDDIEPIVRHLAALGHKAPSQTWQRQARQHVQSDAGRRLVREWIRAAAETGVAADGHLFTPSNEDLVRAAVVAARWLSSDDVPAPLLGALARQGAATRPPQTESLALRVATAAIDSLVQREAPADIAELEALLESIARRDLVKRIGTALGSEATARAATRDDDLKREKAAAVRAKANPIPRVLRGEVDRLLRDHVDGTMRGFGFRKSGRTWRRTVEDRVEVVDFFSSGLHMSVHYGVLFPALHPEDGVAAHRDPQRVKPYQLDVSIVESAWFAEEDTLERLAARVRSAIVPFLGACGDRARLAAVLTTGEGIPAAEGVRDPVTGHTETTLHLRTRPFTPGIALGALSCVAGDRLSAQAWLDDADAAVDPLSHPRSKAEIDYWRRRLAATE
ncbi:DUF4304 domain-containing protein [Microbacterium sp. NPDC059771]|uniref:DUF4304 domain-containing protein n=1 Tax=Microbacterium sp. NPDC059771 TaxID=3346941 RepID=UPI0036475758